MRVIYCHLLSDCTCFVTLEHQPLVIFPHMIVVVTVSLFVSSSSYVFNKTLSEHVSSGAAFECQQVTSKNGNFTLDF